METRNVTLTLNKAKEFYNSGNAALKEVALQAFTEKELNTPEYTTIKTFEDAVKALGMDMDYVQTDIERLNHVEGNLGAHLVAIYKLAIIRKALNMGWEPKLTEGCIYYSWVRVYLPNKKPSGKKVIATLIADGQKYLLVGGFSSFGYYGGLSTFHSRDGYGNFNADLGLLCCKTEEIAKYMSEQFGQLIFDACYAQHIDSYEWV